MYVFKICVTMFLFLCLLLPACGAGRTGRVFTADEDVTLAYRPRGKEQPGSVFLSGSFNTWHISDPAFKCIWDPLEESYTMSFKLAPGRYEYRFVVDGRWILDPDAREDAPDPLGGRLGVFYVVQTNN